MRRRSLLRSCLPAVSLGAALAATWPALALDPERSITTLSHRMWQDELPQTTVHAIVQTRDGYLWFATYDGLVRFDGVRFTVLETETHPALPGSSALALHEDAEGRLWVGTNAGVAMLAAGVESTYTTADGLPGGMVVSFSELADGSLWVGTTDGPARFDGTKFRAEYLPGAVTAVVRGVEQEPSGRLWVCTDDGVVLLEASGERTASPFGGLADGPCRALLLARDGTLWVGTGAGLAFLRNGRPGLLTTSDGLPSRQVRALFEDRDGALWIGTQDAGVARLVDGRVSTFDARCGLTHNLVRSVYQDREGSIWVGTNAGLDQLREAKVTAHTTREGLSNDFVRAVLEDRHGVIWIGTDGGGLDRYADGRLSVLTIADGLPSSSVRALAETPDGALWLGTRAGVCRMKDGRFTAYTRRDGLSSDLIRALYPDRDGVLWVGTEGGGLNRMAGGSVEVISTANGLAGDDVRAIFQDSRGRLFVATFTGLSVLENGSRLVNYRMQDGLADDDVFCFFEDVRGGLWIGTEAGLCLFRDGAFATVGTENGLVDGDVYWILADDQGNLWTTSNRGVSRLDLDSLYDVVEGRAKQVRGEHFDTSHGMPTDHCNGVSQPAGWRTRAGRLWFPTTRGAVEIDPAHLVYNDQPPPVLLEEVVVDGEVTPPGQSSVIGPGRHNYELRYTALSFAAPERVRFRYRLVGYDAAWTEAGTRRTAYYTRLPPGSYAFRVVACNNDGVWNEEGASHRLQVRAAFWQGWWARLLYLVAFGAVLLSAHRLQVRALARRNRQLEAKVAERTVELDEKVRQLEVSERQAHAAERSAVEANRAKSLFVSTMSHELRTPLNAIIGFAAILSQRLEGVVEPRHYKFLGNIHSSGLHLLGLINDLLDLAKVEAGRMELVREEVELPAAVEGVCRLVQGVSDSRQITLEVLLAPDLPNLLADSVRVKQILFNLLSNAVKFSPDGSRVTVKAEPVSARESPLGVDTVRVDVVDRGIGIAKEHHALIFEEFRQVEAGTGRRFPGTGLGLSLVKRLVELHGGTILLDSEPGRGSTFSAFLPVAAAPRREGEVEPPAFSGSPTELPRPVPAATERPEVLVVEDDPVAYHQLAAALEADGFAVRSARTGEEALARLEEKLPALITLDLVLPGLDGWEVLRAVKSASRTRAIPVVILTRRQDRDLCLALGADDFALKPVDRNLFLRRVEALVARTASLTTAATVLLVDDDQAVHELLREELEAAGFRVRSALGGRPGLELARRERPDLVVLDLVLPDLSGFEVARELRRDPTTAAVPIIVLTATDPSPAERELLANAISALLAKGPDSGRRLVEVIRGLLAGRTGVTRG